MFFPIDLQLHSGEESKDQLEQNAEYVACVIPYLMSCLGKDGSFSCNRITFVISVIFSVTFQNIVGL